MEESAVFHDATAAKHENIFSIGLEMKAHCKAAEAASFS